MSLGMRVAAGLAWPVFAVIVVFLLSLVLVAAAYRCTRDGDYTFNASKAGAWKLAMSIETFRLDCGRLPDRLDELTGEARSVGCAQRPWAKASDLRDAYGTRFVYWRSGDGSTFEVRGIGRDRVYGSADDVTTADWTWPWPEPFWRSPPWNCVIATLPWFSIALGPAVWLMILIVRRLRRTARRHEAVPAD